MTVLSLAPTGEFCRVCAARGGEQTDGWLPVAVNAGAPSAGRGVCTAVPRQGKKCVQLSGVTVLKLLTADIVIGEGLYQQGLKTEVSAPT